MRSPYVPPDPVDPELSRMIDQLAQTRIRIQQLTGEFNTLYAEIMDRLPDAPADRPILLQGYARSYLLGPQPVKRILTNPGQVLEWLGQERFLAHLNLQPADLEALLTPEQLAQVTREVPAGARPLEGLDPG